MKSSFYFGCILALAFGLFGVSPIFPVVQVSAAAEKDASILEWSIAQRGGVWLTSGSAEFEEMEKQKEEALSAFAKENGKTEFEEFYFGERNRAARIFPAKDAQGTAQVQISRDSGKTWSEKQDLVKSLTGECHCLTKLQDGRVAAAFLGWENTDSAEMSSANSETKGQAPRRCWYLWIGNFHDLEEGTEGVYRLKLGTVPADADVKPVFMEVSANGTLTAKIVTEEKNQKGELQILPRWLTLSQAVIGSLDWQAMQKRSFPKPEVVEGCQPTLTPPPEGAVVLFDGTNLDAFNGAKTWTVGENWMQVGRGSISTKQKFGSCRIHLEFATPAEVKGKGQGRGNSGLYILGRYELQILDSWKNDTYPQGQCGAIYTQNPPAKNVCRKPGEWQSFDVIFTAPKFSEDGELLAPARITAWQNGVLIQDDFELVGRSFMLHRYYAHGKDSIQLQDHSCAVRFRNFWVQELE